jgi:Na+/melibiose symporter-like transporter
MSGARLSGVMRRVRVLKGWRLWASVGLFSSAFLFAVFALAKVFAAHDSRWDISWTSVAWIATVAGSIVWLWTFLDARRR